MTRNQAMRWGVLLACVMMTNSVIAASRAFPRVVQSVQPNMVKIYGAAVASSIFIGVLVYLYSLLPWTKWDSKDGIPRYNVPLFVSLVKNGHFSCELTSSN